MTSKFVCVCVLCARVVPFYLHHKLVLVQASGPAKLPGATHDFMKVTVGQDVPFIAPVPVRRKLIRDCLVAG